ncbi:LysR family transcriptional regulator [Pyxidicoccus fallax]|uniref:LysR family transcriptional regulator n=1 Tax=Pyxidicoccus fallax TaxID=394095 RepID=A0A848LSS5_9BACT|nr:LysR family transcriptional regulator [Pyxidicoccus fallax]NMO20741.1 LysR family transcriptional regulator [Pyxidicoccus fallax]NPC81623.1 LysR family transcriptional regulator [Pyxidicoccus fallax]
MNLSFIEGFYWAATLESVSGAARRLFITQAAMTARIKKLEEELGTPLLDRRDKRFRLTPAGARFLADAERLLGQWRDIKTGLGSGTQRAVSLRVGAIESVLHAWLIPWLERLRVEHPGIELELTVETTPLLTELLQRGALDVVLAARPVPGTGVKSRALPTMPLGFVGHRELHTRRRYTLEQLAREELVTFQRGSQPHLALLDMLREEGIDGARVHTLSSISAMVRLVSGGFGVATLPHAALERIAEAEGLRLLPCDTGLAPLPIHASWRVDPTSRFFDTLVESVTSFAGGGVRHRKK